MFIVGKKSATTGRDSLTLSASRRTHTNAKFLRSTTNPVVDELLIETTDLQTGGYDRLCVVFRHKASLQSDDPYDAQKIFNHSGGVNQIYTRASDNKQLTTNVISPQTDRLTFYFEPSDYPQEVSLGAYRLQSLQSVSRIYLEDTKTSTVVELTQTPSYRFTSSPSDRADRFVLHFGTNPTGIHDALTATPFSAVYEAGSIQLSGLSEKDKGSDITLYNMQGQTMLSRIIQDTPSCRISKDLSKGIYIVKTRTQVTKLSVK
jgi:hypothetical protein